MTAETEYVLRDKLTLHPQTTDIEHYAIALRIIAADVESGLPAPIGISYYGHHERLRLQFRADDLAAWCVRYHVAPPEWVTYGEGDGRYAEWPGITWGGMPFTFAAFRRIAS